MACLQISRELLSFATFLRVHSNSKEVSCLFWQNTYLEKRTYILQNISYLSLRLYGQKKLLSDMITYMILKNIHIYSLYLLELVFVFYVEITVENARVAILERLEF